MLSNTEGSADSLGGLHLPGVDLAVFHRERMELEPLTAGDGSSGVRVEAAAQQDDGFPRSAHGAGRLYAAGVVAPDVLV